jgi:cell wall-associated NlpC family hydrolase
MPFRFAATYQAPTTLPTAPTGKPSDAFMSRLQAISDRSTASKDSAIASAAQRKADAAIADQAAATAAAQASTDAINKRLEVSKAQTTLMQSQAQAKLGQNQTSGAYRAPIGTSAASGKGGFLPTAATSAQATKIVQTAMQFRGDPYVWGGSSPKTSFDCSGLVQWAYKAAGVNIPRISNAQAVSGRKVSLAALRPGDIVAWDNSSRNAGADHVAIYIGNGQIIESSRPGQPIAVRTLGNEKNAWGVQILGATPAQPNQSQNVGTAPTPVGSFGKFTNAIAKQESGGNYGAVNKSSGALGKYQIMPANIASWSKDALGYSITPAQFLGNPKLQETIAQHKLSYYFNKYGAANAAKAWYGGEGSINTGGSASQGAYPTKNNYSASVLRNMR